MKTGHLNHKGLDAVTVIAPEFATTIKSDSKKQQKVSRLKKETAIIDQTISAIMFKKATIIFCLSFLLVTSAFAQINFPDDYHRNNHGTTIGQPFLLENDLINMDGEVLNNDYLKGKVIYLSFWFTACGGCKQESGVKKDISNYFKENPNIEFWSIAASTIEEINTYFGKFGDFGFKTIPFENFKNVKKDFNVKAFPTMFIISDGIVKENLTGPIIEERKDWVINKLEDEINLLTDK